MYTTDLYFECHITIDPVIGENEELALKALVHPYQFRVADLLMKKGGKSSLDSFMTTRGTDYEDVLSRTLACVKALQESEYVIRRYKIENTLLDVRLKNN